MTSLAGSRITDYIWLVCLNFVGTRYCDRLFLRDALKLRRPKPGCDRFSRTRDINFAGGGVALER